uniref:Uncharacterized protein n=1 Tax=Lepeophtheirus salmonis TaxID=72036 RepID=A0A0K2VA63_LEPSM
MPSFVPFVPRSLTASIVVVLDNPVAFPRLTIDISEFSRIMALISANLSSVRFLLCPPLPFSL